MSRTWVVVAESSRARICRLNGRPGSGRESLEEVEDRVHPESRLPGREIDSDRHGRAFDRGGQGRHAMSTEVSPREHEAERFAKELCEHLEALRARGELEELYLVAPPRFLGMMREHMPEPLARTIVREVAKNLVREPAQQIQAVLAA